MKTHHTSVHPGHDHTLGLADQDAAIDAYLDGLLRDPDSAPYWADDFSMDSVDDDNGVFSEETGHGFQQTKRPVGLSLVDLSKFKVGVAQPSSEESEPLSPSQPEERAQDVTVDVVCKEAATEEEAPVDMPSMEQPSEALSLEMETAEPVTEQPVDVLEESEASVSVAQPEQPVEVAPAEAHKVEPAWQVFAMGHLKVALPRAEIYDIIDAAALRSIPGAPSSVAGAVTYQDRTRMILSLDAWMPQVSSNAKIVLLGPQGLWGVRVGAELVDLSWDDAETSWRDASERGAGRPWLAGVNRAAGVAFLAVDSLRSALSGAR
jgi:purine-binding chemotaxis protein CheW